jgi:site-specific recombinase XerD
MNNEIAIAPYICDGGTITASTLDDHPIWSVDLAIKQWLDAKFKHTQSQRTNEAYDKTITTFRAALQSQGLDLDSIQDKDKKQSMQITRDRVKQIAQLFASFSKRGRQVKQSTINHRYAVLSSFYGFCIKQEWLDYNPIDHLDRAKVQPYADVKSLPFEEVAAIFDRFDLSALSDLRDCALLAIGLQTGRRVSELAGLRWKHVTISRAKVVTLDFARCKGNKSIQDELDQRASEALLRWLHKFYGQELTSLSPETSLWVSLARGCDPRTRQPSYGKVLSIQALGQICLKWTGTAHIHRLRNTFVMGMLESGAKPQEIQGRLLHSSLATTSAYVDRLTSAKNPFAGELSKLFNIK